MGWGRQRTQNKPSEGQEAGPRQGKGRVALKSVGGGPAWGELGEAGVQNCHGLFFSPGVLTQPFICSGFLWGLRFFPSSSHLTSGSRPRLCKITRETPWPLAVGCGAHAGEFVEPLPGAPGRVQSAQLRVAVERGPGLPTRHQGPWPQWGGGGP